jgi:hypothetical protein
MEGRFEGGFEDGFETCCGCGLASMARRRCAAVHACCAKFTTARVTASSTLPRTMRGLTKRDAGDVRAV